MSVASQSIGGERGLGPLGRAVGMERDQEVFGEMLELEL